LLGEPDEGALRRVFIMPREEFNGATLEEVQRAIERWRRDHPGALITKTHTPVEFVFGGAHFLGKEQGPGKVIGAMIVIDYEVPEQGSETPSARENVKTNSGAQEDAQRRLLRPWRSGDWKVWVRGMGPVHLVVLTMIGIWIFAGVNPFWQLAFLFTWLSELLRHFVFGLLHLVVSASG
jgi:hypothetical protein